MPHSNSVNEETSGSLMKTKKAAIYVIAVYTTVKIYALVFLGMIPCN
jgi:hypothetical protein